MNTLREVLLLLLAAAAGGGRLQAQPPAGSQVPRDENFCVLCHTEADLWEGDTLRLYVSQEVLDADVHWQKGVNCHDCHGGNYQAAELREAHATEDGFRTLDEVRSACGHCHQEERIELAKGVHAKAGERDERGRGTPMACGKCHGEKAHGMLPVKDSRSPVFLDHQVRTCGGCHADHRETYYRTVHGQGLEESGLLVTAVCADCHGAHGIYYAADRRSTLHPAKVADTCGKCHYFIEQRLQKSAHGQVGGPGELADRPAPGGTVRRKPSCTSCHQGHHLLRPDLAQFHQQVVNRCGNCHADHSSRYAMSLHGELTRLGYEPAATCADCHGAHNVLPVENPQSCLAAGRNRERTCQKCHLHVGGHFTEFDPHANPKDARNFPGLASAYHGTQTVIYVVFGVFALHAFLWFLRSFVHTFQHGGHRTLVTGRFAVVRFQPIQRLLYALLVVSFLGLVLTGLPLKFHDQRWARTLADGLGGFGSTRIWHHTFAVLAIFSFVTHLVWGATRIARQRQEGVRWWTILSGPDSRLPNLRDLKDVLGMVRWFLGLGPKPIFERWTYWEKFDYWAVWLAALPIVFSGLALWYPYLFSLALPGSVLNLAKVIHSGVALAAASLLFVMHFFHTHFRPEKFPMDLSALTGLVSEDHLRWARPDYVERLERTGRLESLRRRPPSRKRLRAVLVGGFLTFSTGLCLLAVILLATLGE